MKKVNEEFKIGKNNIGYVSDSFLSEFGNDDLPEGKTLSFQTLKRNMYDSEILSELKVGECTLADVLETLKNAPETIKDGYSNIFYIKGHSHVVDVGWSGGDGGWGVGAWCRGSGWGGGRRVFSPANESGAFCSGPSSTQTLEFCECKRCGQCGKVIQ